MRRLQLHMLEDLIRLEASANDTGIKVVRVIMVFSLITVFSSWCFGDWIDDDIPTVKAFKKSHTFMYIYVRLYSHMVLAFTSQITPIDCTHLFPLGVRF